jgi:hypothetical protein
MLNFSLLTSTNVEVINTNPGENYKVSSLRKNMLGRKPTDFITVKDVPAHDFIVAYAQHLKKNNTISAPDV